MDEKVTYEPDEYDGYIRPTGPLGSQTAASIDGHYIGTFSDDDEAIAALRVWMNRAKFWPNVWSVSDHGNVDGPIDITDPEVSAREYLDSFYEAEESY